jgi:uncharacterized damage-inducible protein DinB
MIPQIEELNELFQRDLERLESELQQISDDKLWETMPGAVNSVGVLTQHIVGNLNHFIGTALGKTDYIRDREREFTQTGVTVSDLINHVDKTSKMINNVLVELDKDKLSDPYPMDIPMNYSIQKFLLHLYGHLNYHLGQANYLRRNLSEKEG